MDCTAASGSRSGRVGALIAHVEAALAAVEVGQVAVPPKVMTVGGFCGLKTRQFIHQLCGAPIRSYLEVGVLHGATLGAAIAGNPHLRAVGIDNFSQPDFHADPDTTRANLARLGSATLLVGDAFEMKAEALEPVDVFFYDGDHGREATERGLRHFRAAFASPCVVLVDDFNWEQVQGGVYAAGLRPEREYCLGSGRESDAAGWWNGLYVAVVA